MPVNRIMSESMGAVSGGDASGGADAFGAHAEAFDAMASRGAASSVQTLIGLLKGELTSLSGGTAPMPSASSTALQAASARPGPASVPGSSPQSAESQGGQADLVQALVPMLQQLLTQLGSSGGSQEAGSTGAGGADTASLLNQPPSLLKTLAQKDGAPSGGAALDVAKQASPDGGLGVSASPAGQPGTADIPAQSSGPSSTSAGTGPNAMEITNTQDHAITVGKFKNGESATDPSASITLQPGQTGTLHYENGEAGFAAQADASGKFQPTASRLEYEADKDGKMKYPDISYIDGRNASISLSDGAGLNKGDSKSIAAGADPSLITTDSAGNKTIAGWYDGSTAQMQAGGAYMESQLGTTGAYLHPNDDTLAKGDNPMSATQSATIKASFGAA